MDVYEIIDKNEYEKLYDKNKKNKEIIFYCVKTAKFMCLEVLDNMGWNMDVEKEETPLHIAVKNNDIESIKILIKHIRSDKKDKNGKTAMEIALNRQIDFSSIKIVRILLKNCEEIKIKEYNSIYGQTIGNYIYDYIKNEKEIKIYNLIKIIKRLKRKLKSNNEKNIF